MRTEFDAAGDAWFYNEYGTQVAHLSKPRQADIYVFTASSMILRHEMREIMEVWERLDRSH